MVLTLLELGEEGTVLQPLAHVQVGVGQPDVHLRVWVERCLFFTLFFSNLLERNARNAQAFAFFPPFFLAQLSKCEHRACESFLYSRTAQAPPGPLHLHKHTMQVIYRASSNDGPRHALHS